MIPSLMSTKLLITQDFTRPVIQSYSTEDLRTNAWIITPWPSKPFRSHIFPYKHMKTILGLSSGLPQAINHIIHSTRSSSHFSIIQGSCADFSIQHRRRQNSISLHTSIRYRQVVQTSLHKVFRVVRALRWTSGHPAAFR